MRIKKIIFTLIIVFIPIFLFAQEGEMRGKMSFWQLITQTKYIIVYFIAAIGIYLIWAKKLDTKTRIILMSASFLIFGTISYFIHQLFITPTPVCSTTKPFLFGLKNHFLATLIAISILSLIATKGFCGTACPVGALQELLYKIPFLKKLKKNWKVPFKISNSIRTGIAVLFFVIVFTLGFSIYAYINLFDLIHWNFEMPPWELLGLIVFLIVILAASLVLFRPFCYFICPMGLLTWLIEQFSFMRVRIDKSKCTSCGICEVEAPCPSFNDKIDEKKFRADCHLCGTCINECVFDAVYFGLKKK
jgi:polyferredoxin